MEAQAPFTTAAFTFTVTEARGEVPPGPVHWKVKVVAEVRGLVRPEPERVPELLQGPPAVQEVALVEDQVRVERPSYATGFGEAVRVAVGAEGEFTFTVTDARGEVPPGPVHWKVKVVAEVRGLVRPLPERVLELDQGPPAVQEVALVEDQVRVERPSYATGFGEAVRVAVGGVQLYK